MDLVKRYIIQSISAASNNLRLNTQKIEVVALLRETIAKSNNLENNIKEMKKVTELSTFAIRLHEIYNYLTQSTIDFFKISEKFKEHSQFLIRDLSFMLDMVSPVTFRDAMEKSEEGTISFSSTKLNQNQEKKSKASASEKINIDLSKRHETNAFEEINKDEKLDEEKLEKVVKDEDDYLFDEEEEFENDEMIFEKYEETILKPVKPLDNLLKRINNDIINSDKLNKYANLIQRNAKLSEKIGFDIIAGMHKIVSKALLLIKRKEIVPTKDVIEAIRACLIVIVAVVRGKEVDITNYLNKAEEFGNRILTYKIEGH